MGSNLTRLLEEEKQKGSKELNLSQQNLADIPTQIVILKETLEKLNVSSNLLTTLPYEISKLSRLRVLDVSRNTLRSFPSVLFEIPSLEHLDISRNKIKKFPKTIGNLISLKTLILSKNRLVELPKYISDMSNLKILRINDNPIVYPPKVVIRREKNISEDDWLVRLKDWLKYDEIKTQNEDSESETDISFQEIDSTTVPKSHLPGELLERAQSLEELRKVHSKQKEKLARQYELEIKLLREKHEKELRREYERHQILKRQSISLSDGSVYIENGTSSFKGNSNRASIFSTFSTTSGISTSSSTELTSADYEKIVEGYFKEVFVQNEGEKPWNFLHCCRCLIWANCKILRTIRIVLSAIFSSSTEVVERRLLALYDDNCIKLMEFVIYLQKLEQEAIVLNKSSTQSSPMGESRIRHLKPFIFQLIVGMKTLILAIYPSLKDVINNMDERIDRSLVVDWYAITAELISCAKYAAEAVYQISSNGGISDTPQSRLLFTDQMGQLSESENDFRMSSFRLSQDKLINGSSDLQFDSSISPLSQASVESPTLARSLFSTSRPTLSVSLPAEVKRLSMGDIKDDPAVVIGEKALAISSNFIAALKLLIENQLRPQLKNYGEHDLVETKQKMINDIDQLERHAEESMAKFSLSMKIAVRRCESEVMQKQFFIDANTFVTAIMRLNVVTRVILAENIDYHRAIRTEWQDVTTIVKELAIVLTNHPTAKYYLQEKPIDISSLHVVDHVMPSTPGQLRPTPILRQRPLSSGNAEYTILGGLRTPSPVRQEYRSSSATFRRTPETKDFSPRR